MAVTTIRDKKTKKAKGYRVEVYVSGVRVADRMFDAKTYTKSSAVLWHAQTKAQASKGYIVTKTFGEVVRDYVDTRFKEFEATTQQSKNYKISYLSESPLARLQMRDISPVHITEWIKWLKLHAVRSPKRASFAEELRFLSSVFHWHRENHDPSFVSPIMAYHREKEIRLKDKAQRRPDYFMRPEEIRSWLSFLETKKDRVYFELANLMIHTGLRVGEAAALCWDAVSLSDDRATLQVIRTVAWDRKNKEKPKWRNFAKTGESIRGMRIPPVLVKLLSEIKTRGAVTLRNEDGDIISPVFCDGKGNPLGYSKIKGHFNRAFKKLGQDWHGTHIARHSLATLSLLATKDQSSVQAVLGHTSSAQTQKYAKVIALQFGDTLQRTADLISDESQNHAYITQEVK